MWNVEFEMLGWILVSNAEKEELAEALQVSDLGYRIYSHRNVVS